MIKVVYDINGIKEEVNEWLKDKTGHLSTYGLPRHHPLLVQAVENVVRDPDMYIREIEGTQYSILSDAYGNEQIWTPEDFNWVEVVINEKEQERKLVELESTINVIIEDKMNKPIEDAVKTLISSIANKQEKEKLDLSFNERMIREARDSLDTGLPFPSSHGEHFYKYLNALSGAVAQIQRYINNQ